jgi:prevent-host-death family protein
MIMIPKTINIADAKKGFSALLGRVAYGKEQIIITKRGKPMARLVPTDINDKNLVQAKGWLEEEDPFFKTMERIVQSRSKHTSRLLTDVKSK